MTRKAMEELIELWKQVPAEKVDMHNVDNPDCGCLLVHIPAQVGSEACAGLPLSVDMWLYAMDNNSYPNPKGQAGKDECLRRLRFCLQFFDEGPADEPEVHTVVDLSKILVKS